MTTIKDKDESSSSHVRIVRTSLLIDLATMAPVLTVALLSNSLVLLTDVFDYAYSITANLISWLILRRLAQGRIEFSDYGPGKLESLGGLAVSGIMLAGLAVLVTTTLRRFLHPEPMVTAFVLAGIGVHIIGLAINGWLWWRTFSLARAARSHIMEAQWRINRTNTFGNVSVIVSLTGSLLFHGYKAAAYLDPICALVLAGVTGASFLRLIREALADILDRTISEDAQLKVVKRLAENYEMYDSFHGVRSRRVGARTFIEIQIGFDPERRIGDALDVMGRLRESLEQDIPGADVRVTLSPTEDYRDGFRIRAAVKIVPLADAHLEPVMDIMRLTFPRDNELSIRQELEESIWPGRHTAAIAAHGILRPRYWVAVHGDEIVGLTGLYFSPDDVEAVWGGWTASSLKSRASISRVKMLLLRKVAYECRNTGRHYFRLFTSTLPGEAQANRLYDNIGMTVYRTAFEGGLNVLYRQIETTSLIRVLRQHSRPRPSEAGDIPDNRGVEPLPSPP